MKTNKYYFVCTSTVSSTETLFLFTVYLSVSISLKLFEIVGVFYLCVIVLKVPCVGLDV